MGTPNYQPSVTVSELSILQQGYFAIIIIIITTTVISESVSPEHKIPGTLNHGSRIF